MRTEPFCSSELDVHLHPITNVPAKCQPFTPYRIQEPGQDFKKDQNNIFKNHSQVKSARFLPQYIYFKVYHCVFRTVTDGSEKNRFQNRQWKWLTNYLL